MIKRWVEVIRHDEVLQDRKFIAAVIGLMLVAAGFNFWTWWFFN
ncbi:hypothetical protein [Mucilaginibacter endophyticus]|nr:hypothetical protein [Mucilaginibacter endophyticus]